MGDYPTDVNSVQVSDFEIYDDNTGNHRKSSNHIGPSLQADIPPLRRTHTTHKDQEDLSVEEFMSSEASHNVPRSTRSGLSLLSSLEQAADVDRASLNSDSRRLIQQSVDQLIEEVTRATRKAHEDKLQTEIEAQWGPRCKDWLNRQLVWQRDEIAAEHLVQNRQHWEATEGVKLRTQFVKRLDEAYHEMKAKAEGDYKLQYKREWENGERHKYFKYLKAQLEVEVKAELKEELKSTVVAELQATHLPSLQMEARRDILGEISQYQNISQFAQNIGSRLTPQSTKSNEITDLENESADSEDDVRGPDFLDQANEASKRLNSVLEHGQPKGSASRQPIGTSAYASGLFGIFPLGARNISQYTHHPQRIQSGYIQKATVGPFEAARNHGIVGQSTLPGQVQALKPDAIAAQSAMAPPNQIHQPILASQPFNTMEAKRGTMPPPPRPIRPEFSQHPQPAFFDPTNVRMMAPPTGPQPTYKAQEISTIPMLPQAQNPVMASSYAHEQGSRDQNNVVNAQAGESREPTSEPLVRNEATGGEYGVSGPADPAASTDNTEEAQSQTQGEDRAQQVHTGILEAASVPPQTKGKKRMLAEVDDADIRLREHSVRDGAAKPRIKRTRVDPPKEIGGPSTRTRAAARKAAAEKLKASPTKQNPAVEITTCDTEAPVAVLDAAPVLGPAPRATMPSTQLPSQPRGSGMMKRGRDPEEAEEDKDEARMSPPPAKRARHAPTGDSVNAAPHPDATAVPLSIVDGPSSVAATDRAKREEQPTADRSKPTDNEKTNSAPSPSRSDPLLLP
ncbi:MAG: hypothetical protein Q9178_006140 [Gyalolechia marmorata]